MCSREVDDRGQHSDEPTGPAGRNGQPMTVPADRHYDAKLIASWPVA